MTTSRKIKEKIVNWIRPGKYFDINGELKLTKLHPAIIDAAGDIKGKHILDFGCGDGKLSNNFAERGAKVLAVDKSERIIKTAKNSFNQKQGLRFECVREHVYKQVKENDPFDIVVLSFVIITIPSWKDVDEIFSLISAKLVHGGRILFGESHPCYHHKSFSTFKMNFNEKEYRGENIPFKVEVWDGFKPHKKVMFMDNHRPLATISEMFAKYNFYIRKIRELYDDIDIPGLDKKVSDSRNGSVPAFILIEAVKV